MDKFSNSHKAREEREKEREQKADKVITGKVVTKKKSELGEFVDSFIMSDLPDIKHYILFDLLGPSIKKFVLDSATNGLNMLLYGEEFKRPAPSSTPYISYGSRNKTREPARIERQKFSNIEDYTFTYRSDAEAVLEKMRAVIEQYDSVSVADFYDMIGETAPYTGDRYGWTDLRRADVVRVSGGYAIKLPKAYPID